MSRLVDGVREFRQTEHPKRAGLFESLAGGQKPNALFITCSDSRVNPTLLTGSEPGDLFVVENAGNIVPPPGSPGGGGSHGTGGEAATLEYAVRALGVPEIVVCGHARCGAMGGLMAPDSLSSLPLVADWLKHSASVRESIEAEYADAPNDQKVDAAIKANVRLQLEHLKAHDCVREAMEAGSLSLGGWVYDFVTGEVIRWDDGSQAWVDVA